MPTRFRSLANTILTAMQTHDAREEQRRRQQIEDEALKQRRELFETQLEGQRLANVGRRLQNEDLLRQLTEPAPMEPAPRLFTEVEYFGWDHPQINVEPGARLSGEDWDRLYKYRPEPPETPEPGPLMVNLGAFAQGVLEPYRDLWTDVAVPYDAVDDIIRAAVSTISKDDPTISLPMLAAWQEGVTTGDFSRFFAAYPDAEIRSGDLPAFLSAPGINVDVQDAYQKYVTENQPIGEAAAAILSEATGFPISADATPAQLRAVFQGDHGKTLIDLAMAPLERESRQLDIQEQARGLEDVIGIYANGRLVQLNRDEAIRLGLLDPKKRTYTLDVPLAYAREIGVPKFIEFDDPSDLRAFAETIARWYEANRPEEMHDVRELLRYPGVTEEDIEQWRNTYGNVQDQRDYMGGEIRGYMIPVSTYERLKADILASAAERRAQEAAQTPDEKPAGFTEEEWQEYQADLRALGNLTDVYDIVMPPTAWKKWRSIPPGERPPLDDYAIQYTRAVQAGLEPEKEGPQTVTYGQLLEMAGIPAEMAPVDQESFAVPVNNISDLTLAISRVRREFQEATGQEVDALDLLSAVTSAYEGAYHPLDPERPTLDQFVLGEFSNMLELVKMVASGEPIPEEVYDALFGDGQDLEEIESGVAESASRRSLWDVLTGWIPRLGRRQSDTPSPRQEPGPPPPRTDVQATESDRFALYGDLDAAVEDALSMFDDITQAIMILSTVEPAEQSLVEDFYGVPFDQLLAAVIERGRQ